MLAVLDGDEKVEKEDPYKPIDDPEEERDLSAAATYPSYAGARTAKGETQNAETTSNINFPSCDSQLFLSRRQLQNCRASSNGLKPIYIHWQ